MYHNASWLRAMLLSFSVLGCAGGEPPSITDLEISTNPVVRGEPANGSFVVLDPDGLADIEFDARLTGPQSGIVPFAEPSFPDDVTEAKVAFALMLTNAAPTGRYQLIIEAIDADDMVSDEAVVEFNVE